MAASNELLEERVGRHSGDLKRAFKKIETLDGAQSEQAIKNENFQNVVTELGASLTGMKDAIEHISGKVDDIAKDVSNIKIEVATLKAGRVDYIKILKFFSTTRGVILLIALLGAFVWGKEWVLNVLQIVTGG